MQPEQSWFLLAAGQVYKYLVDGEPLNPPIRPVPVRRGTASAPHPPTIAMPPGPSQGPAWASLPHELVQQAARLLGDDDKWVGRLQGACRGCVGRAGEGRQG